MHNVKEKIENLKHRLFEEIPSGAFFTPEQELIVKGLLFDAVDETVTFYEKMRRTGKDEKMFS